MPVAPAGLFLNCVAPVKALSLSELSLSLLESENPRIPHGDSVEGSIPGLGTLGRSPRTFFFFSNLNFTIHLTSAFNFPTWEVML